MQAVFTHTALNFSSCYYTCNIHNQVNCMFIKFCACDTHKRTVNSWLLCDPYGLARLVQTHVQWLASTNTHTVTDKINYITTALALVQTKT